MLVVKGRELELDISLLAAANFKNLWKISIWAEEFFYGGVDLNPLSTVRSPQSAVRSPQSAVHSPQYDVRTLYTVEFDASYITELENRWQNRSNFFPSRFARCDRNVLKSKNIVSPRQNHSFSSSSKYGTGMDSEMMQDILFENEQKYSSRLKHADTVALIRAPKIGQCKTQTADCRLQTADQG